MLNRGNDDIHLCGCRDADVAVFEGGRRMIYTCVGAEMLMWRCLKEGKHFLSALPFNLYIL